MIPREEWHLDTRRLGRRVLVYNALDSTNTQAAALANDLGNDGLVILADCQTAGRGQQGRKWFCTPGTGVLMSVLLFPPPALRRPALLTALAAVSVCETIGEVAGLESAIKWPNDVLSAGRKVCGILIEQGQGTVIGMGLNVRQTAVELAGLPQASSLLLLTGKWLSPSVVARRLIERLDEGYHRLCSGDLATLEKQWQDRLGLAGHMVVAEVHGGTCRGRLQELSWQAVQLALPDGSTRRLLPEAIRHLSLDRSATPS